MHPLIENALTVDVEEHFHAAALAQVAPPEAWPQMESRVEANTQRMLDLFDLFRVRATFFVLGWVAERLPGLTREIADRGHEVASHGYSHQLIYRQSPALFREETLRAKGLLEELTGVAVRGYRAATYSITRDSLWALDILCEAGFGYDSSIFPIRHDRYGIVDAALEPGVIATPRGGRIVEFPLTTVELAGWRMPLAGGGYFRLYPYAVTRAGLAHVNRSGRPFIFYLHPWEIDPGQPRLPVKGLAAFRHYNQLHRCEERLRRLLGEFRFGPVRSVLDHLGLWEEKHVSLPRYA